LEIVWRVAIRHDAIARWNDISGRTSEFHNFPAKTFEILQPNGFDDSRGQGLRINICKRTSGAPILSIKM
jgi:hypothetical protein